MSGTRWLPRVAATDGVPPAVVARVHEALQGLPPWLTEWTWSQRVDIALRHDFSHLDECEPSYHVGHPWSQILGYWDADGWVNLNGSQMVSPGIASGTILHELGHAMTRELGRPHVELPFRSAWKVGRERDRAGPRIYHDLHWTRATDEVWAECFAWTAGSRAASHPRFGKCYRECVDLVAAEIEELSGGRAKAA